jgi:hypothetical protein
MFRVLLKDDTFEEPTVLKHNLETLAEACFWAGWEAAENAQNYMYEFTICIEDQQIGIIAEFTKGEGFVEVEAE